MRTEEANAHFSAVFQKEQVVTGHVCIPNSVFHEVKGEMWKNERLRISEMKDGLDNMKYFVRRNMDIMIAMISTCRRSVLNVCRQNSIRNHKEEACESRIIDLVNGNSELLANQDVVFLTESDISVETDELEGGSRMEKDQCMKHMDDRIFKVLTTLGDRMKQLHAAERQAAHLAKENAALRKWRNKMKLLRMESAGGALMLPDSVHTALSNNEAVKDLERLMQAVDSQTPDEALVVVTEMKDTIARLRNEMIHVSTSKIDEHDNSDISTIVDTKHVCTEQIIALSQENEDIMSKNEKLRANLDSIASKVKISRLTRENAALHNDYRNMMEINHVASELFEIQNVLGGVPGCTVRDRVLHLLEEQSQAMSATKQLIDSISNVIGYTIESSHGISTHDDVIAACHAFERFKVHYIQEKFYINQIFREAAAMGYNGSDIDTAVRWVIGRLSDSNDVEELQRRIGNISSESMDRKKRSKIYLERIRGKLHDAHEQIRLLLRLKTELINLKSGNHFDESIIREWVSDEEATAIGLTWPPMPRE